MKLYSNFIGSERKNVLFNGNFDSWPTGLTFTNAAGRTALMMHFGANGGGAFTVSADNTSKPNDNCIYTYKVQVTTAKASYTGADYVHTMYYLEGLDFLSFVGKTATLSFWVRSSVAGKYGVFFRSGSADASYVQEFTINTSNVWEYKTIPVTFDYSIGTWSYSTDLGVSVGFSPALGTTYATSTFGQWISGNYIGTTNQVNFAATVGNTFQISQLQLEVGSNATPFKRPLTGEFGEMVGRYYQIISLNHLPATSVNTGTGNCYCAWDFPSYMRVSPTITHSSAQFWSPHAGWVAATAVQHSNNNYRCVTTMQNTTTGYTSKWPLLMIMDAFLDARL